MPVCTAESMSDYGQRGLMGRQDQKQIKIKNRSRSKTDQDQDQRRRSEALLGLPVGAAEGCEGGCRFAAFGSSYRELCTPWIT